MKKERPLYIFRRNRDPKTPSFKWYYSEPNLVNPKKVRTLYSVSQDLLKEHKIETNKRVEVKEIDGKNLQDYRSYLDGYKDKKEKIKEIKNGKIRQEIL